MRLDPECEAAYPARRSAVVEIETVDGRRVTRRQPTRKGDPDAPLSDDELRDKFLELATPVLGEHGSKALLDQLRELERLPAAVLRDLGVSEHAATAGRGFRA
jgi:2-methylcitrate dehydratase PrpD